MSESLGASKFRSLLLASSLEMTLSVIALLTDSLIAGHAVGEAGLSAMNIITPIISVPVFLASMFSVGLAFCYNSALGMFDTRHASGLFGMGIILMAATSLTVFAGISIFLGAYLDFLNVSPEVRRYVIEYYSCYKFVILVIPFSSLMSTMVYQDGDDLIANIANFMNLLGNIVLSLIFTFVFKMGMFGIALGTLLKELLCLAALCCHFLRETNSLHARAYFSLRDLWSLLKYGFVDSGMFIMLGLLVFVMDKFVTAYFGDFYLPVLSMVVGLLELSIIFDGVAQAMLPLVSVYYSEGNYPAVRKVMKPALKVSLIEGVAFSVVLFVFAEYIPAAFNIREPELVPFCVEAVRIIAPSMVVSSLLYLFETYYTIQDKNALAVISSCLRNFAAVIVISLPLGLAGSIGGVWAGVALAQVLTLIVCGVIAVMLYGREGFPMYLADTAPIADFDLTLSPENIIIVRDKISEFLSRNNVSARVKANMMLIAEEVGMLIYEKNAGRQITAEYTVMIETERVELIIRDNGIIFDITDEDAKVESFRSYVVSNIMTKYHNRENLLTTSFNRNVLRVQYDL